MEKVDKYRSIIHQFLAPFPTFRYSDRDVENELVFDETRNRYLVMQVGWEGRHRRIHGCLMHLDIIDGRIWIQRDGTEDGIAYELEAAGVLKEDIVPAFHPRAIRPLTGYGVG